ncbi:MAG: hypothetical protein WD491_10510 [Balneolales bacterium]
MAFHLPTFPWDWIFVEKSDLSPATRSVRNDMFNRSWIAPINFMASYRKGKILPESGNFNLFAEFFLEIFKNKPIYTKPAVLEKEASFQSGPYRIKSKQVS